MSYTVKSGDNLSKIAAALGLDGWRELYELNKGIIGDDANLIRPGQVLQIPGEATAASEDTTAPADAAPAAEADTMVDKSVSNPVGTSGAQYPGVLNGGRLVQVERTGQDDIFAVMYEWPTGSGTWFSYEFDSMEQVTATFGPNPVQASGLNYARISESQYKQRTSVYADAEEIIGVTGSFGRNMQDAMQSAAISAGINDPTLVGRMAADPEMQRIMVSAVTGDWTPEQLLAAQRKTKFWTETLYPGIDNLYGRSVTPELDWKRYQEDVTSTLAGLGYPRDADGSYRNTIGKMLDSDINSDAFVNMAPTYTRALQSTEFRESFNEWASTTLGREVTFEDWFNVLAGEAEVDLALAAERATIDYVSNSTGTLVSNEQIVRLAGERDLTENQVRDAFAQIDQAMLGLLNTGAERYGLSADDIFAAKTGITPRSGKNLTEINSKIVQGIRELGLADDEKIALYTSYSENRGTPYRPGLNPLAPEGA